MFSLFHIPVWLHFSAETLHLCIPVTTFTRCLPLLLTVLWKALLAAPAQVLSATSPLGLPAHLAVSDFSLLFSGSHKFIWMLYIMLRIAEIVTMRYQPHPNLNGCYQKENKCWRGCEERGTTAHCWWKCKLAQLLWRTVRRSLKKLKLELPYDLTIHYLVYIQKEISILKACSHPCV